MLIPKSLVERWVRMLVVLLGLLHISLVSVLLGLEKGAAE